ncbi:MAG: EFR1 family ferrodoxin [Firmicutes bacterium]|nr:EFR1 family ferrodoxin [Bacillota bacterium]
MKLLAIYFSGTGNTQYAVRQFCSHFESAIICSIEDVIEIENYNNADTILIAYPIYGSDMPYVIKDFLKANAELFRDKNIITLATQLLFSGDGGVLATRLLKRQKIKFNHIASIHINMPSNISDLTVFKIKNGSENDKKIAKANKRIGKCVNIISNGKRVRYGRRFFISRCLGLFTQRLTFRFVEKRLRKKLKIDSAKCIPCVKCIKCCPASNIVLQVNNDTPNSLNKCTLCYRCINLCPQKAISLMIKRKPKKQYKGVSFD